MLYLISTIILIFCKNHHCLTLNLEQNPFVSGEECFQPFPLPECTTSSLLNTGVKTNMFLFTRHNADKPEFLHRCGSKLPQNTNYNVSDNTEIFTHGYLDGVCLTSWMKEIKDSLLKRGSYNVILIDWSWGNGPHFSRATNVNSRIVGNDIGILIKNIMNQKHVGPEKFHLIGHSLGAAVVGFAGQALRPIKIRRITGLEPPSAQFETDDPDQKLDKTDANLVDMIHTNGGSSKTFVLLNLGNIKPLGHADFYVNGGVFQPSFLAQSKASLLKLQIPDAVGYLHPVFGSHLLSTIYYKESINSCPCLFVYYDNFLLTLGNYLSS